MNNEVASSEKIAQVNLRPEDHAMVGFTINGHEAPVESTEVSAALLGSGADGEFVVGVEESIKPDGDRERKYLKIPRKIREAGRVAVEYYECHETLAKGTKAAAIVAGAVAVGSLVVMRIKNRSE